MSVYVSSDFRSIRSHSTLPSPGPNGVVMCPIGTPHVILKIYIVYPCTMVVHVYKCSLGVDFVCSEITLGSVPMSKIRILDEGIPSHLPHF